jgi:hypothetical protein
MGTVTVLQNKANFEIAAGADTVHEYDIPTSNTVKAPTCTGAQGLFAHAVLRQLKDTHGIRNTISSKVLTLLQVRCERGQSYLLS